MNPTIRKYKAVDYNAVCALIESEGAEWKEYLHAKYQTALEQSITYVASVNGKICGYSRSISDFDLYISVIDLLVHKDFRGHEIGKALMECVKKEFPDLDVIVLSDVDGYYEKLGYKKEGTIFKVM